MTVKSYIALSKTGYGVGGDEILALANLINQTGQRPERYILYEIEGDDSPSVLMLEERKSILHKPGSTVRELSKLQLTENGYVGIN